MATLSITADVRPAKITCASPGLSKTTARAVETARLHLRYGNLAGEHRATNPRQQRAIEAVIAADAMERLFTRHPANGCLMAQEA